jgi:hypothetical protein
MGIRHEPYVENQGLYTLWSTFKWGRNFHNQNTYIIFLFLLILFFPFFFSFLFPNNIIAFFLLLFGINKTQALDLGPIIKKLYLDLYIVNL